MSLFFKKDSTLRKIECDINKTEKKYFCELISSLRFVLSKHITTLFIKFMSSNIAKSVLNHFVTASSQYSDLN